MFQNVVNSNQALLCFFPLFINSICHKYLKSLFLTRFKWFSKFCLLCWAGIPTWNWSLYFWLCKNKNIWWRIEKPLTWVRFFLYQIFIIFYVDKTLGPNEHEIAEARTKPSVWRVYACRGKNDQEEVVGVS